MITREWAFGLKGGSRHYRCPQCRADEYACSVWDEAGYRHVKCHRASCGAYAKYSLFGTNSAHPLAYGQVLEMSAPTPPPEVLRPYTGDRIALREADMQQCIHRWGFIPLGIQTVGYTTEREDTPYILPICAPNGTERGVMEARYGRTKYRRIWKAKAEPMISWTPEGDFYDGVYLVEDQISALKLHDVAAIRAVALLGTDLNAEKVAEIQRHAKHVTIALDADATAKAFKLARRWGAAFKTCRVQILLKDIKDSTVQEIQQMVRNAGHGDFGCEFSF